MLRLYHLPLSPFCRKIRLVLAEKKIDVDLVVEFPWDRRLDYLRQNPSGKVPMLRADGLILAESSAIFEYLEEVYPAVPLLPSDPAGRAEARRLAAWFDDKFHHEVTVNLLYERINKKLMKTGHPDSSRIKAGAKNINYHKRSNPNTYQSYYFPKHFSILSIFSLKCTILHQENTS